MLPVVVLVALAGPARVTTGVKSTMVPELARLARPFAVERTMLQSFEDVVCGSWVLGVVLRCVVPGEGQDTSEIQ